MGYKKTLQWMFAQLPMYQKKGRQAYSGKLETIQEFTAYLDDPQHKFKSIHVAGTNGKGSCSHMLSSVLQEAGYSVGLYTSPHLKDFRERIKINGANVPKAYVVDFVQEHQEYIASHHLSFFEMTVAMAFTYFAMQQVDIAVVEVGLGGRLDSTNIITPEICLITNIGYDHQSILGNTLEKIAMEKAGIIKPNVPVIISEHHKTTAPIFNIIATQKRAKILFAEDEVQQQYQTDLLGAYQQKNIKGVVACIKHLKGFQITEQQLKLGLQGVVKNTGLLGRWQILSEEPKIICDTAHNKEGLSEVLRQLKNEPFKSLHVVLGFVNDKDVEQLLSLFPRAATYYFVKPKVPRGMDLKSLKNLAAAQKLRGKTYDSVKKGLKAAKESADKGDIIYVGGSTFVVAEVV